MKYTSKMAELRLIWQPTNRMLDDKGRVVVLPGKKAEFVGYKYATLDPEMITWLHNHHLRGIEFDEIKEEELDLAQKQFPSIQIVDGATNTLNNPAAGSDSGAPILNRPEDKIMLNSDLAEVINRTIDEKIGAALSEIKALLQKDTVKEEKVKTGKSQKTFTCPYCKESFSSGFKVGKHKSECSQRPQEFERVNPS